MNVEDEVMLVRNDTKAIRWLMCGARLCHRRINEELRSKLKLEEVRNVLK
jgi:hypothetical protein